MKNVLAVIAIGSICAAGASAEWQGPGSSTVAADKAMAHVADSPPPDLITVGEYSSELLGKAIQLGFVTSVVKGAPYSAQGTTTINSTLADGTHIARTITYTICRDSAGRLRREDGQEVWISDPVAQMSYILNLNTRSARRVPLSLLLADAKRNAAQATTWLVRTTRDLGKQVMEGVNSEGSLSISIVPTGQIGNDRPIETTTERWYAPELRVEVMSRSHDPRTGETLFRLTNIRRSEPDASRFRIPPGFSVGGK